MSRSPNPAAQDWTVDIVLDELRDLGSDKNRAGMARFGIETDKAFGVPMAVLRPFAKRVGKSSDLAKDLWNSGFHETRLLAVLIVPPKELTAKLATAWLADVNSWDLCDQLTNVFAKNPASAELIADYIKDEREFVRRAGFALIAWRALPSSNTSDQELLSYFPLIEATSTDKRNYVWKAVHWALRQIGKKSLTLHGPALELAIKLEISADTYTRRVGREAVRELSSQKVIDRLSAKAAKNAKA
ncbi:MAG: DNA alkylation repair protein [Roseibium sp.]